MRAARVDSPPALLYDAYPLSLRNLEEMMAERGVLVDRATVHRWALNMLLLLDIGFSITGCAHGWFGRNCATRKPLAASNS